VVDGVVPRQLSVAEVERQSLGTRARTQASIIYGVREVSVPIVWSAPLTLAIIRQIHSID